MEPPVRVRREVPEPRVKRLLLASWLLAAAAAADVNGIVLRVGDRIATLYDYRQRYGERLAALRRRELPPEREAELLAGAGRHAFCELFQELLMLAHADQQRLELSEEQVDEAVTRSKESLGIENEEQFQARLEESGISEEELREQMRRNLLMQQVMGSRLRERVQLDEEDLRRYYQSHLGDFQVPRRVQLREVVVREGAAATPAELQRLAEALRERALAGEGLAVAAAAMEAEMVTDVIDLGWVEPGDLDPALEAAIEDRPAGEISPPVAARGGMHLVEVLAVEESRLQLFDEVRGRIEEQERERLIGEEMEDFLGDLVSSTYIVEKPPPEAVGYRDECLSEQPGEGAELAPAPEPSS